MKKLYKINPKLLEYCFNYDESSNYSKSAFEKYKDSVVYMRKTPKYYFVLLRGKTKFFGYKFKVDTQRIKRCLDLRIFNKKKGRVYDNIEFMLFKRRLILERLAKRR